MRFGAPSYESSLLQPGFSARATSVSSTGCMPCRCRRNRRILLCCLKIRKHEPWCSPLMIKYPLDRKRAQGPRAPQKPRWRVILGKLAWSKYTYDRPPGDPLQLLGSVSRAAQMGALAITSEGLYVQVVGDYVTELNQAQIAKALAVAQKNNPELAHPPSDEPPTWQLVKKPAPAPTVIIKRRRVIVRDDSNR